jgi:hypothetical protein
MYIVNATTRICGVPQMLVVLPRANVVGILVGEKIGDFLANQCYYNLLLQK